MALRSRFPGTAAWFLMLVGAVVLLGDGCQRRQPNVILISIDTLRADRLGAYGFDGPRVSPHIDALAGDGILFESCITASPWTTPAHMSLLTSLNPGAHGIIASFAALREDVKGEHQFVVLSPSVTTLAETLAASGLRTAAFTAGGTVDPRIGFGRGFDSYDTSMVKLGDHNTPAVAEWLDRHSAEPFFLFLHTFEVHAPYVRTRLLDDVLPPERAVPLRQAIDAVARTVTTQSPVGSEFRRVQREVVALLRAHQAYTPEVSEALYLGGIQRADEWLGSLVADLKRMDLYDDALIVLTGDHGEEFADHAPGRFYNAHGQTLYEEMIHVPLIVKLPGGRHAGRHEQRLVRLIDVMPTVLDLTGVEGPSSSMQGVSLRPLWEGDEAGPPRVAISEALAYKAEEKSIRTDRYKLVVSMSPEQVEEFGRSAIPARPRRVRLFDLVSDPRERRNLLSAPASPKNLALAAHLEERLREAVAHRAAVPDEGALPAETLDRLRGLGYVED